MRTRPAILMAGAFGLALLAALQPLASGRAQSPSPDRPAAAPDLIAPGLRMPSMDAARGRRLFASKGCVVCHAINGVGGHDARRLDASTMQGAMNPFDFAAKMWRSAEAMVAVQREELGEPISLTGQDLADIVAFVHDPVEQTRFSESQIPPRIRRLMGHMHGTDQHGRGGGR